MESDTNSYTKTQEDDTDGVNDVLGGLSGFLVHGTIQQVRVQFEPDSIAIRGELVWTENNLVL